MSNTDNHCQFKVSLYTSYDLSCFQVKKIGVYPILRQVCLCPSMVIVHEKLIRKS